MAAAQKLQEELIGFPAMEEEEEAVFSRERRAVQNMKKIALLTAGLAVQKYSSALEEEQELMMHISDIVMESFAAESALLRTQKIYAKQGEKNAENYLCMTQTYLNDSVGRVEEHARAIMAAVSEGDTLRTNLAALRRFLKFTPINTIGLRRQVADSMLAANKYPF
jgi:hypothetical protein